MMIMVHMIATRGSRRGGDGAHELFRPPNADGIVPHLILGISKSSAIVRPAEPALSWITLRIREALRGGRHEREIGTKRYCRTLLGPKIYWLPKFIRRNPKTLHMLIY